MKQTYEILEPIAVIGESDNMTIEVNVVQINGKRPVLDIRPFKKESHEPAYCGVWLLPYQVDNLRDLLNELEITE